MYKKTEILNNPVIVKSPKTQFSELSHKVLGCAIEVHRALGPGLLESAYQQCLCHELSLNQIRFEIEKPLPVHYKGISWIAGIESIC
jgi:GxxExxY protein